MKVKRFLMWRWCPHPEHMKASRTRPTEKYWVPLVASSLILTLLAVQGIQMWTPSAFNAVLPNSYAAFPAMQPAFETPTDNAPAAQLTSAVSTEHLTVQLTFPESTDPGQTITISATTTAKSNGKIVSLTIEIFSYADKQLVKVASESPVKDKSVHSGDAWQTPLSVVVPTGTQRSAMIGTVTEVWEETTTYYYGPSYYGAYAWPYYPSYAPDPYSGTMYYYVNEPSYVTVQKSATQSVPLTYVLATTPEYEQLLNTHQQLRKDYDDLAAKYNELSSNYNSLKADYDQTVSKYNKLQSDYNSATQELGNYRLATYILIVVAVALGIALAFAVLQRQGTARAPKD
jgi:hypothetical protein